MSESSSANHNDNAGTAGASDEIASVGSTARERMLAVAERLFSERGYASVTLRDIADALGIRQASLYHHAPGGKEQIFVEVTERALFRLRHELEQGARSAEPTLDAQLTAVALTLLEHPPIDLTRMTLSDMPEIDEEKARHLTSLAFHSLIEPIMEVFTHARSRSELWTADKYDPLLAVSFFTTIETIHIGEQYARMPADEMAEVMIEVMRRGLSPES